MRYCKFILILLLLSLPLCSYSVELKGAVDFVIQDKELEDERDDVTDEETQTIEFLINNESKVKLRKVPKTGVFEIYTILGVKKGTIDLKKITGEHNLNLKKGIYIFKAGKVAQKVIVK